MTESNKTEKQEELNKEISMKDVTDGIAGAKDVMVRQVEAAADGYDEDEVPAVGWDAITAEFERVYPGQTNPLHYAPPLPMMLGGKDPLQGISVYDGGDYWHFVSYGLSELYDKQTSDPEYSGFGMEYTFKLKKENYENEAAELSNVVGNLQVIARIPFVKRELILPYEYVYSGQTTGIDAYQKSDLVGFISVPDPTVNTLETPNGKVEFVEFIGVTKAEIESLSGHDSVKEFYEKLGSDVTDYHRGSLV